MLALEHKTWCSFIFYDGKMAQCFVFIVKVLVVLRTLNRFYQSPVVETISSSYPGDSTILVWRLSARNDDVFNGWFAVGVAQPGYTPVSAEQYSCRDCRLLFRSSSYGPTPPRSWPAAVALLLFLSTCNICRYRTEPWTCFVVQFRCAQCAVSRQQGSTHSRYRRRP